MRTRHMMIGILLIVVLLISEAVRDAYAFTPVQPGTINGQPFPPGGVTLSGGSSTVYAMHLNRMAPVTPGTSGTVDASAWLELVDAAGSKNRRNDNNDIALGRTGSYAR